jgi:hypothetical protein
LADIEYPRLFEVNGVRSKLLVLLIQCVVSTFAIGQYRDPKLETFKSLPGPQQVATIFHERFHGRSLLFWKRSSDVWRTAADARLHWEEDILVASAEPSINSALVAEIRGHDVERARYAVFLLCLRARFVSHSDFLIKQVNSLMSSESRDGRISPFPPDLGKLDQDATLALSEALTGPNEALRNSAKIYTFTTLEDLSSLPTVALVERWNTTSRRIPACHHDRPLAYWDVEQSIPLFLAALASRGLEAAIAVSSLLKNERNAEARGEEIELVRFLDSAAVRLRRSEEGRQAIQTVKEAVLSQPLQYCGMRYNWTDGDRRNYWLELENQFLQDRVSCDLGSWATLVAVALDQQYGDRLSAPFEKDYRVCNDQMQGFISWLTEADPAFPAWDFPSTGTQDDMLHPNFVSKIHRYHEMWIKMNADGNW